MKIVHHIGMVNIGVEEKAELLAVGVNVGSIGYLRITEDDPRWQAVEQIAKKFRFPDTAWTEFSDAELSNSSYVRLVATWHNGYPESSDDGGYRNATFGLSGCANCRIARQVAPFRLKKTPNWGKRSVFGLYWVHDAFFVRPELWRRILEPVGIGHWPVLLDRDGTTIESVVQIKVDECCDVKVDDLTFEQCDRCGEKKYVPVVRGFSPAPIGTSAPMVRSNQYFGHGGQAYQLVYVSRKLYPGVSNAKGVAFKACK